MIGVVVVDTGAVVVVVGEVVVVVGKVVVVVGNVVVVVGVTAAHVGTVTEFVSSVTAPLRASSRPETLAPVVAVMELNAIKVPANELPVPKVAEDVTCQKTLQACAPFSSTMELADAVVNPAGIWMMNVEVASLAPLSVSVPVRVADEATV